MKSILLGILTFLSLIPVCRGQKRSADQARQVATEFFSQNSGLQLKSASTSGAPDLAYTGLSSTGTGAGQPAFYIYNLGSSGFVIVSADERTPEILAYSPDNRFSATNMPANLARMLQIYSTEIEGLDAGTQQVLSGENAFPSTLKLKSAVVAASVLPLLGHIQFNQDSPFNDLCPVDQKTGTRTVTGCEATGMAQVMKFYQYPATGTGSNTYTTKGLNLVLTANFGATNYNWATITDTYSSGSTTEQKQAVATLVYHCGVASNMDYGAISTTSTGNMLNGLINHFGYDPNPRYYYRSYFTLQEWKDLIKADLNAGRPVFYEGSSGTAGHLWVVDGYDANDLFHMNWGWGGLSNGYYRLTALNPDDHGIGGNGSGYNESQAVATYVRKPDASTTAFHFLGMKQILSQSAAVERNAYCQIDAYNLANAGINSFTGTVSLNLYNEAGTLVSNVNLNQTPVAINQLPATSEYPVYSFYIQVPAGVANGKYKLFAAYQASGEASSQLMRAKLGYFNYLNVEVTDTQILIGQPQSAVPALALENLAATSNFYSGILGTFDVKIKNNGAETYQSYIAINLKSTDGSLHQQLATEHAELAAGASVTYDLGTIVQLPAGSYELLVLYDATNNPTAPATTTQLGASVAITVKATPTGAPSLELASKISFPDATQVNKRKATLTAEIKNSSADGLYNGQLYADIHDTNGTFLKAMVVQTELIDLNTVKTVTFEGPIDLPVGDYKMVVYYVAGNQLIALTPTENNWLPFTLIDKALDTGIDDQIAAGNLNLFPNPANDRLYLESKFQVKSLRLYNLSGQLLWLNNEAFTGTKNIPVATLQQGIYLLRIETEKGIGTQKFVKH